MAQKRKKKKNEMKQQPRVIGELTLIACGNHLRASAELYGQSKIGSSS